MGIVGGEVVAQHDSRNQGLAAAAILRLAGSRSYYPQQLMSTIILTGSDEALLEGLSQSLTALGHRALLTGDVAEAIDLASPQPPLIAIVAQAALRADARALRIPVLLGGAILLYRGPGDPPTSFAGSYRSVLAELVLPLERNRLFALVQHVEERARVTGREPGRDKPRGDARPA